jgi:hypothetical protein
MTTLLALVILLALIAYAFQSRVKIVIRPVDDHNIVGPNIVITKRRYEEWLEALLPWVVPVVTFLLGVWIG